MTELAETCETKQEKKNPITTTKTIERLPTELKLPNVFYRRREVGINQSINQSTLFNEGDTKQSGTDKPVALGFRIKLEFGNVGF